MCFSPYLGVAAAGGGTKGSRAHNLLMQFSGLGSSKMEISETDFFDTLTIQNHRRGAMPGGRAQNSEIGPFPPAPRPLYIGSWTLKAQYPVHVFFTLFGCGGGGTKGSRAHNLLMQFCGLGSSKMEISETDFFHTLTIQNDQISYVKHVLAPLPSSRCLAEGNRILVAVSTHKLLVRKPQGFGHQNNGDFLGISGANIRAVPCTLYPCLLQVPVLSMSCSA